MCPSWAQPPFYSKHPDISLVGGIYLISNESKVILILMALFALLACDAFAGDLSARAVVALGSAKLSAPSAVTAQAANNSSTNTSFMNNTSMNSSATGFASMNISAVSDTSTNLSSMNSSIADSTIAGLSDSKNEMPEPVHNVPVMDLSRYAKDRLNKKLGGYRNIIYPMAESSGFSATTSSGSGGGCGC